MANNVVHLRGAGLFCAVGVDHYPPAPARPSARGLDQLAPGPVAHAKGAADAPHPSKSLVLTTNKSFSEWATIFPGAACATALVDRVVHHADVIHIEGKSYRLRESELAQRAKPKRKRKPPSDKKPPPKKR